MKSNAPWSPLGVLDELDQRIVHALQVDGRAAFRRIGEVLEVSDQTVARRYTRLRTTGTVKVLGLVDPLRIGVTPWFVRVRCAPDGAAAVGEAIARRTDTRWVSLLSGGTEISCVTHSDVSGQSESLLLQKLPRTPQVVRVTAHALLHVFFGRDLSPVTRTGPLDHDRIAALTADDAPLRPLPEAEPVELGPSDRRLLDALALDGRTSAADLADVTGWSQTTVRRRMSELRRSGVLYYDLDLDFDGGSLSPDLRAALWLEVEPARLAEVGAALTQHTEVAFAAATTGTANVFASIQCKGPDAFYRYLTGPVAALPGIRRTETAPIHITLKGPGPLFEPARLRARDRDRDRGRDRIPGPRTGRPADTGPAREPARSR